MHEMTGANLRSAYGGESMAHMRYRTWGIRAEKEGFPNVGRLFRAIAYAEEVHANNHFRALAGEAGAFLVASGAGFGLGSTVDHLTGAIEGEEFEISEMYPVYKAGAEHQGEARAAESFHYALEAERIHARLYREARSAVEEGRDVEWGPVRICDNCGHTLIGDAPDKCPICQFARDHFRAFA